jgi:hypothetical protein
MNNLIQRVNTIHFKNQTDFDEIENLYDKRFNFNHTNTRMLIMSRNINNAYKNSDMIKVRMEMERQTVNIIHSER